MTLLAQIRSALRAVAEPARAAPMQAYMKSTMPYLGVTATVHDKQSSGLSKREALEHVAGSHS